MSKTNKKSNGEFILEVTQEEYDEAMKKGWTDDDIQKPGKHRYRRVPPERVYKSTEIKVRITLEVDGDVLMHFRQRSENDESFDIKLNQILRAKMERDLKSCESEPNVIELTKDKEFIQAVAEQVKELIAA